jgi:hypothetical protein
LASHCDTEQLLETAAGAAAVVQAQPDRDLHVGFRRRQR